MELTIDFDLPKGYDFVRYGYVKKGDTYVDLSLDNPDICQWSFANLSEAKYAILKPVEWIPKEGETYFHIRMNSKMVGTALFLEESREDGQNIEQRNYWRTKERAEKALEELRVIFDKPKE
jgi:hypothetical protein